MTHMNNYGLKERLAISLFKNLTNFVDKWTNLEMQSVSPVEMANKYFELYHKQMEPVWTVSRLGMNIYSQKFNSTCFNMVMASILCSWTG